MRRHDLGPRVRRRPRGHSAAVLVAALTAAISAGGCAGGGFMPSPAAPSTASATQFLASSPSAAPETPGGSLVVSEVMPFQLQLPPGWEEYAAGPDEQSFGTADGSLTLIVGRAVIEPGQVVADRVAFNRAIEFKRCTSDASQDQPITIDGQPGILWSVLCGDRLNLAANTIHGGRGYRLTLQSLRARRRISSSRCCASSSTASGSPTSRRTGPRERGAAAAGRRGKPLRAALSDRSASRAGPVADTR